MKKMNRKGFTIVELVIVIAVIAILAGVLIPTFSGLVQKAQDSAAIQEARNKYTEYVGLHDYSKGTEPEKNIVIELGDGTEAKYVTVIGAQLKDKVYTVRTDAEAAAKYANGDAAAFICDKHDWKSDATPVAAPECEDCDAKCEKIANDVTEATCPVCGLAADKHPASN